MTRISKTITLVLLLLSVFGCGKNKPIRTEAVTGVVTLDGVPVEGANIVFSPKDGGNPGYGISGPGGAYTLQTLLGASGKGTTTGEYAVSVTKNESVLSGETRTLENGKIMQIMKPKALLPEVYSSEKSTPITFAVKSGSNQFNIELKSKP